MLRLRSISVLRRESNLLAASPGQRYRDPPTRGPLLPSAPDQQGRAIVTTAGINILVTKRDYSFAIWAEHTAKLR